MSVLQDSRPAILGGRPVRKNFLVFGAPCIGDEEVDEVVATLRSGWIGFGPKCLQLESAFAEYVGAQEAISLASCTAGLHLALLAIGVGPGDEVITTPLTFPATVNVIEHVGARPMFVDVDPITQNIDPGGIEAAVSPRTKAVIPVHIAGRPCNVGAINDIANRHGLTVIADAAHAIEARADGQHVATASQFTVFSFYPTKNMTTIEGGMLTTSDPGAAGRIRILRLHGISENAWERYSAGGTDRYEALLPGYKYNLTDVQAAVGIHQLTRLEANLAIRERHWQAYDEGLADVRNLVTLPSSPDSSQRHARHLYSILLRTEAVTLSRDQFVRALKAENVGCGIHFVPVHLHTFYRNKYGFKRGDYPHAEDIGARTVSLPLSPALTERDTQDVLDAVHRVLRHFRDAQ